MEKQTALVDNIPTVAQRFRGDWEGLPRLPVHTNLDELEAE